MIRFIFTSFIVSTFFINLLGCQQSTQEPNAAIPSVKTTQGDLAINNLNAQIEGMKKDLQENPDAVMVLDSLVPRLLTRAYFLGTISDYQEAEQLIEDFPNKNEDRYILLKANLLAKLHRFKEAEQLLSQLDSETSKKAEQEIATIQLAQGSFEGALNYWQNQVEKFPSFDSYANLAVLNGSLGAYEEAEKFFDLAISSYTDVSPFPVAWLSFQMGMMWAEHADRPDLAEAYYQQALSYLPQYVTAAIHLAEIDLDSDRPQLALNRLLQIKETEAPEYHAVLGEVLIANHQSKEAEQNIQKAEQLYEAFLKKYPQAFYHHAAEFYVGIGGQAQLGFTLALKDLSSRKTFFTYRTAIEAALVIKNLEESCSLAKQAIEQLLQAPVQKIPALEKLQKQACVL